ncbi:MAG: hypothetical protein RLZZ401_1362, partial [Pseudomonadota bacterium]
GSTNPMNSPHIWQVGALCRAIADVLDARFNPVAVRGEVSGFSRASSGHCYFALKDESGQIRCAMFRRAAMLMDFQPRDGELVEVRGRLDVYGARGDLQLIVESMTRAGQGALFEQFLKSKAKLEAEGLFDAARKLPLPAMPRAIGVVTSLNAAALHDVVTALQRRAPHVPVVVVNTAVQGANAVGEMIEALSKLYLSVQSGRASEANLASKNGHLKPVQGVGGPRIDVILLVRGGGSMDDLWAFNDERLVRVIAQSPVPVVSGVGHETDFTLADFVADLRAPTPTAAAELVAVPRQAWLDALHSLQGRLADAVQRRLDAGQQRLDATASHLVRPSALLAVQRHKLEATTRRVRQSTLQNWRRSADHARGLKASLTRGKARALEIFHTRLERAALRLQSVDPARVLERGYAWVTDDNGQVVRSAQALSPAQALKVRLAQGQVGVTVTDIKAP